MKIHRIPWLIGQFLPLGSKLGHHLFETDSSQVRFWRATGEYIFLDPIAAYKTTLNLSVEFCMGAVYIDRLPAPNIAVDRRCRTIGRLFSALPLLPS